MTEDPQTGPDVETIGKLLAVGSGVPAPIAQGAFKGIGRLIGGLADYPAAWLRRASQGVEDGTNARTTVSNAVAAAAAAQAINDPAIVDRAVAAFTTAAVRKQANRERVAHQALEALQEPENSPSDDAMDATAGTPPPADDWLNVFERYAEDASSERMQLLWGKVLAGEIRKPQSFSLSTMRFLSEADQDLVSLAQRVSQYISGGLIIKTENMDKGPLLKDLLLAQDAGLVSAVGGLGLSWQIEIGSEGFLPVVGRKYALRIEAPPHSSFEVPIINVSKVGLQISQLSPVEDERKLFVSAAEVFKKAPVTAIHVGRLLAPTRMAYPSPVWEATS